MAEETYNQNLVDDFIRVNPQTKMFEPVLWKKSIVPYWLLWDQQFNSGAITVPATGQVTTQYKTERSSIGDMGSGLGTPFRVRSLVFEDSSALTTANSAFTVSLTDIGDKTQFMNAPIHIQNFAGTAQLAAGLSEPLFLPSQHVLQAAFAGLGGGTNPVMRLWLFGQTYYPWDPQLLLWPEDRQTMITLISKLLMRRNYIFPFWLTTPIVATIPANGIFEIDVDIGDDGHFEATHLIGVATSNSYVMNILDPDTKRSLSNGQLNGAAAVGTAQNPQRLAVPWLFPAGKRLRFQFTDLSGSTNIVHACLRGQRIRAPLKNLNEVKRDTAIPANMQH